jgi:CDP-diglyceride synthetase
LERLLQQQHAIRGGGEEQAPPPSMQPSVWNQEMADSWSQLSYDDHQHDRSSIGGGRDVVSVIPEAILPRTLSGMSLQAFSSISSSSPQDPTNTAAPAPAVTPAAHPHHLHAYYATTHLSSLSGGDDQQPQQQQGTTTTTTAATTVTTDMAMKSARWISFRNRALTAIGMMTFLAFLSYYFQEDGLTVFTVLLQAMMFQEMTSVIGGDFTNPPFQKWWWFVTSLIVWDATKIFPWRSIPLQALAYGMTVLSAVVGQTLAFQWGNAKPIFFREYIRQAAVVVLSAMLVVWPSSYWIATLEEHGMKWVIVPAAYIIINDTMAYIVGQWFGKHPLLKSISPKKTWEGFVGAALATVGVAYYLGTTSWMSSSSSWSSSIAEWYPLSKMDGLVLAGFVSFIAPFGGFLASIIKRAYGQKDFGAILPGHGGLVDRLDCQLLLAPAVYFYLTLVKFVSNTGGGSAPM